MRFILTFALLSLQGPKRWYTTAEEECGLYLAVSSTSNLDEVKWGVYAGVDIEKGSLVGEPDLAVQTHNLLGHAHSESKEDQSDDPTVRTVNMFEEYIWVADATGGSRDLSKPGRMVSAIMGAGFLGAYNGKLTNTEWYHGGAFFREALGEMPGIAHPGRGASSHFYNVSLISTEDIIAGSEIFMDYGTNWEEEDEDDEEDDELHKKDFKKIDEFVGQMIDFFAKHEEELTEEATAEIYDFLVRDIINAAVGPKKGKKIHALLPKSPDQLHEMKKVGSLLYSQPEAKQKMDWLKENGLCMDNMKVGASTIPYAGRGAFAKRSIKKGGLIAPVPVMHAPEKTMMNMYEVTRGVDVDGDKFTHRVNNKVVGQQLLLNYCYGHPDSSMLLIPTGTLSSFINHSSEKANAKLVFSNHKENKLDMLKQTPAELLHEEFIGIVMEIVALDDINEGEEILLDYGEEWQNAWDEHVKSWNAKVESGKIPSPWPTRALDLNQEYKSKPFPTIEEGADYPENIRQTCFLIVTDVGKDGKSEKSWAIPKNGKIFDDENIFDCSVKERIELDEEQPKAIGGLPYNYTIMWTNKEDEAAEVINVPHQAIVFLDKPDTSDQFVKEAFRHYIKIPDEIFPNAWRDMLVKETDSESDEVDDEDEEGHDEL